MYFTSNRDGFMCIWAQPLQPDTKHPVGAAFDVHHFHTSRRSLANVGLGPLETSVAHNALVFNLGEVTGNVWRVSREIAGPIPHRGSMMPNAFTHVFVN